MNKYRLLINNVKISIISLATSYKCIGCATCVEACPTHIIFLDENNKSVICDLCGSSPKCVQWCPKNAISLSIKRKAVA